MGTVTVTGTIITAVPDAFSEDHVSGAAIRAKKGDVAPFAGGPNTVLRFEPTWGDVDILTKIISGLRPGNAAQLLGGFSLAHRSARALQLIRNGAAHNHAQSMSDILNLRSVYEVFAITHPTHAMSWT